MSNYQELTISIFKEIIDKYGFESVKINETSIALVGNKFAILIVISRDGSTLKYVMEDEQGEIVEYKFDSFISSKFDSNDRIGIGNPVTINDIIIAELRISAKGLVNHWQNILNGDKLWISEYENYELGGKAELVNSVIKAVLEPLFNKK
ncbi:hypothetical protein [Clostridium nigeriense]|uniref:hypothetical protein n=1 Tax=Clostridium nigeriense TaxID=1805470 RepID=UPI0008323C06|nr:hypothetical protein [Clostridium nigeriense]